MKRQTLTAALIAQPAALVAETGTFTDGRWMPSNCKARPAVEQIGAAATAVMAKLDHR